MDGYSSHNLMRLKGDLPEKESSKALLELSRPFLGEGMDILEIGCSSGHLLRTLSKENLNLKYKGIDIDHYAISKAQDALKEIRFSGVSSAEFYKAGAEEIPFDDNSFDLVVSLNVLEHLNSPVRAIDEMIRCSRKAIVVRTLMSDQTFIVKEVKNSTHAHQGYDHLNLPSVEKELDDSGEPSVYIYQNVYSEGYINGILANRPNISSWKIFEDTLWDTNNFNRDNELNPLDRHTKIINGKQVRGLFIDTNHWIVIEK